MNAKEFFDRSAGQWLSMRTTHHLPFRRAEGGGSQIEVQALPAGDPQIAKICSMHDVESTTSVGGAHVAWNGTMAWDKDGENHAGSTVFALIPDAGNPRCGNLLRERGYAEIVPVVGRYEMDEDDSLVLVTDYDTTSVFERFWFSGPHLRLRVSTAQRMGGFNTATFCVEMRAPATEAMQANEMTDPSPSAPKVKDTPAATIAQSLFSW
ncbi:MAG: phycobiliprotein lyase [Cyanobacteria bacterium J06641_5]